MLTIETMRSEICYYFGFRVETDVSKAIEICQQAAEKGDMRTQYNLGVF